MFRSIFDVKLEIIDLDIRATVRMKWNTNPL